MEYIGLLRADGTEPSAGSGYARSEAKAIAIFPDSINEGYGKINAVAFFDAPTGGTATRTAPLPEPINVHAGVIPIFRAGKLLRGVAARAEIICGTEDGCRI